MKTIRTLFIMYHADWPETARSTGEQPGAE